MDKITMTKLLIALIALSSCAYAQTYKTVTADTNNVIRTNFTLGRAQISDLLQATFAISNITSLQSSLDSKLATNGNAAGLTNLQASNIVGSFNGTASNVVGVVAIANGGTGATNAANALLNLLPSYTGNSNKILALNSNATSVVWTTNGSSGGGGGGGGLTSPVGIADGGTGSTNALEASTALLYNNYTNEDGASGNIFIGTNNTLFENYNYNAIVIGADSQVGREGISIGYNVINSNSSGIAIGVDSKNAASSGIAIGDYAYNFGSVSIGDGSWTRNTKSISIGSGTESSESGIAIGDGAYARNVGDTESSIAIGSFSSSTNGGIAIGYNAQAYRDGGAVGSRAQVWNGFAGGTYSYALASNNVQLADGYNDTAETIQFRSAGKVTTNQWSALANAGTVGTNLMRAANITNAQAAIFTATTTNAPTNTNAPVPSAWLDIRVGTNDYKLPLWQ